MAEQTGISWADSTANLWIGCQKVSPACDHCYAEDLMGTEGSRLKRVQWGPGGDRLYCKQGWADIRKWNARAAASGGVDPGLGRRRRVFVNSLSDFFDNHRSVHWRGDAWHLIRRSPHVIFMLVTKRPQLIGRCLPPFWDEIAERVWLLTTAEDQEWADRRVPELLTATGGGTPAAVYGVSCEPLLGPIDLTDLDGKVPEYGSAKAHGTDALTAHNRTLRPQLDWVIVGGESGKRARPWNGDWARALRDQCASAGVAFHFKQHGEWLDVRDLRLLPDGAGPGFGAYDSCPYDMDHECVRVGKLSAGRLLDGREHLEVPLAN